MEIIWRKFVTISREKVVEKKKSKNIENALKKYGRLALKILKTPFKILKPPLKNIEKVFSRFKKYYLSSHKREQNYKKYSKSWSLLDPSIIVEIFKKRALTFIPSSRDFNPIQKENDIREKNVNDTWRITLWPSLFFFFSDEFPFFSKKNYENSKNNI